MSKLTKEQKLERKEKRRQDKEAFKKYYEEDNARKLKDGVVLKRLLVYVKPYYKTFIFGIITVLISSFMMSYVSKIIFNAFIKYQFILRNIAHLFVKRARIILRN